MPEVISEFDRGRWAGEVGARLDAHDKRFDLINGSIRETATQLQALTLAIQGLRDGADADRNTVKATAIALAAEDEARRRKVEERWSPRARLYATLGTFAALLTSLAVIYATFHH